MPTDGSNWKDLLKATREANTALVKFHLGDGVDVNFQHPEYLTTPLLEAIRGGHLDLVKILIEEGNASPTIVEELSGISPLECALQDKHHAIVDYLLDNLSSINQPDNGAIIKTVLISDQTMDETLIDFIVDLGHRCVIDTRGFDDSEKERTTKIVAQLQAKTANTKIEVSGETLSTNTIHYWIYRVDADDMDASWKSFMKEKGSMGPLQRGVVLVNSVSKDFCIHIQKEPNTTSFLVPTMHSWTLNILDKISGYFVMYPRSTWPSTVWYLLTTLDNVEGKVFDYSRQEQTTG